MNQVITLTLPQLWALLAGGPIAMCLTVLVGILINNSALKSEIGRLEGVMIAKFETVYKSIDGLSTRIDKLEARVGKLEDATHSPLVKR